MDDDDEFLYGGSTAEGIPVSQPAPLDTGRVTNSVVSHLEAEAENTIDVPLQTTPPTEEDNAEMSLADEATEEVEEEEESDDDDDIEFIMDQPSRTLDLRQGRSSLNRNGGSSSQPPAPKPPTSGPSLTTEYTPISRGASNASIGGPPPPQSQPAAPVPQLIRPSEVSVAAPKTEDTATPDDGIDTSTLPPATAPPSHPVIDPSAVGTMDGRSILDVDIAAMSDKPWRKPGSDISDWFNYGFDEISWESYCYRRRDLGELANVLKTSVLNFSGMPEEQLTALPHEVRQMVMTGTNAMLSNGGPNPGMMGPGVMMDMSGMMNPMAMSMNGDMSMMPVDGRAMGMMPDGTPTQGVPVVGTNGTPEPGVAMMQEGYGGPGMMMTSEYAMQDQAQMAAQQQQMYPVMEPPAASQPPGGPKAGTPNQYRNRGLATGPRGRGFPVRGRGRGGYEGVGTVRPASPLPPGVPTGPRNQNKYKDRDGNAPAVDGLDYGGNGGRGSGEPEDKGSSRKRRSSPGLDDGRSTKRR
ncbi:Fip1-domain-containing protein [Guyanagaster necrorhizus]|uniref:Fip1-domain-containing protein n=1 Tax=Guyanagaster necrorhizus TaxID=856835 RepID=A0A9P8AY56_9AGAR|nr:Fip1-domain-containing protein [Guyanagaster necrorhizus MCA 3950]KAG7452105.1 Fip1-domain-containing protein [Guyanagaster necrorhizus MCA 3950]